MIALKCQTENTVKLDRLVPFQGDLKKRTDQDVKDLAKSLIEDGMLMPFAVWQNDGNDVLLDGHGRLAALTMIAAEADPEVADQEFPCLFIDADSEEAARKSLLQITSSYGRITKKGAVKFMATIPNYRAPAINGMMYGKKERNRAEKPRTEARVTVYVPVEMEAEFRRILKGFEYIRVV